MWQIQATFKGSFHGIDFTPSKVSSEVVACCSSTTGDYSCAALSGVRGWFYLQPVPSFYFRQGGEGVVRIPRPFCGSQRFPTFSPGLLQKGGVCTCRTEYRNLNAVPLGQLPGFEPQRWPHEKGEYYEEANVTFDIGGSHEFGRSSGSVLSIAATWTEFPV